MAAHSTGQQAPSVRSRWDRHFWLATLLAAIVVVPRAALICRAHNESVDDDFHLRRGLLFWTRPAGVRVTMSNPPLGGAISALPFVLLGCDLSEPINPSTAPPPDLVPEVLRPGGEDAHTPPDRRMRARLSRQGLFYGQRLSPPTLFLIVGVWKAILYVPLVVLAFVWCRQLYGLASGWMAALLLVFEPSFAAFIHNGSLDVIGIEAIVFACYVASRYARARTTRWVVATAAVAAFAMLVKHLAMILPGVLLAYFVVDAIARRRPMTGPGVWRPRVRRVALAVLVWGVALWALSGFDVSVPYDVGGSAAVPPGRLADAIDAHLTRPMPAGQYIGSTFYLLRLNTGGQWSYLFGEHRLRGWWYYFLAVATYKVPIGIAIVLAAGLVSLWWVRPRVDELALLVPMMAWGAVILRTQLNIGFRHALPAYTFGLLLATRAVAPGAPRWLRGAAWFGLIAAALHGLSYHPNYHAYLNWPRDRAYLDISDSNVDWGQSLKQVAGWIDANRGTLGDRPIYVRAFGDDLGFAHGWYIGHRATRLAMGSPRPTSGLLIISPIHVVGLYDLEQPYTVLATIEPDAVIADTMLVYDLDKLFARGFTWPALVKGRHPFSDGT